MSLIIWISVYLDKQPEPHFVFNPFYLPFCPLLITFAVKVKNKPDDSRHTG